MRRCSNFLRFRAVVCALTLTSWALHAVETPPTPFATELGRPVIKGFAPQPVLASPQFWSVAQDPAGRVFFGNGPGIVSFDGATWRIATPERHAAISRAVACGTDGRIYAGSRGALGWLQPNADGGHDYVSLLEQVPEGERDFQEIFQIVAHGDAIYFVGSNRILIWRGGRFVTLPHAVGRLDSVGGALYVQSANQPLERFDGDRLVRVSEDAIFRDDIARYFGPAPEGRVLVAMAKRGFFLLEPATGRVTAWPTAIDGLLRTKQIYRALRLGDGSLAVAFSAATGGGLALLGTDGRLLNYLDASNGLPNGLVYGLGAARDGGLWLCLDQGVAYLDWPAGVTVFDSANGLDRAVITSVIRHQGVLYVGSTQGLFRLSPGAAPATGARFERMFTGGVYTFHADADGLLAVADHKLLELTPAGFKVVTALPSLGYTLIRSRRDPAVHWIGHDNGLRAWRKTPTGWQDEGLVPQLNGTTRTVVETADGTLWAAIDAQGFFRVTLTAPPGGDSPAATAMVERIPVPNESALQRTRARLGEWRGSIYFGIGNTQAFLGYDALSARWAPRADLPALPPGAELNVVAQANENPEQFWFVSVAGEGVGLAAGRRVWRARDGTVTPLTHRFTDPAGSSTTVLYEEPAAGVLWIGGTEALTRVEIARAFPAATSYATQVRAAGFTDGQTLPFTRNSVNFSYVTPVAPTRETWEYQTRLEGFDTAWSDWSPDLKRTFTNLTEGRYRFEVRARDLDERINPSATLAFTILPPWWRTWWAYAGYSLAFGGTLLGFARLRTRALRAKNERLEKIVATRTDDLRRQNTELARLHQLELDEKISARLAAEKAQLDVLRYQLNPHFLFNSLTSIRSQIPSTLGSARATLDRLAEFCRLTLHGRKAEERTTVGEEIAMLRAYLDIEQTRKGALLSVEFSVDPSLDAVFMPRLLLLPLVENALKYGQATSEDTLGIKVSAQRSPGGGDGITFEIANTGSWVERGSRPGIPSTGIGHENLRERLLRHYPDAFVFTHSAAEGWVRVRLELKTASRVSP